MSTNDRDPRIVEMRGRGGGGGNGSMKQQSRMIGIAGVVMVVMMVLSRIVITVPTGHTGVKILFNKALDAPLAEGLHFVAPWMQVFPMTIRLREMKESASVPSKEGLIVNLDVSLFYRLESESAPGVLRELDPPYEQTFVKPQLSDVVRGVTASYEVKSLYTAEREAIANRMLEQLRPNLEKRGIIAERVLLRNIILPDKISEAIERKLEQEQEVEREAFKVQVEEMARKKKQVEGEKIREFQRLVNEGLTDRYLQWEGIQATKELAESNNSKVVIVGSGEKGLPLILGSDR